MADILDFKNKRKMNKNREKPKIDFNYLNSKTNEPILRTNEEIEMINKETISMIVGELEYTLDDLIKNDNTSNVYLGKLRGEIARRVAKYNLDDKLFEVFKERGLYFDFKYVYVDEWTSYGRVLIFWDKDYTKWFNRFFRRVNLVFNTFSKVK